MKLHSILTRTVLAGAVLTLASASSQAALITWGAATTIAGDTDVSTNGTLVEAYNFGSSFGGPAPASTTVNGVTFAPFNINPLFQTSYTVGNFTLASPSGLTGSPNAGSSPSAPYVNLTTAYKAMLVDLGSSFTTTGQGSFDLTIAGLTPGATYEFQWWSNESQGGSGNGNTTTATAGNAVTLDRNTAAGNAAGGLGQYAIGTFTADGTSQLISYSSDFRAIINGAQLRQTAVPEPTTALFGLALVGFCTTARRRAQAQA